MSQRILHLADLHLDRAFAAMGCQGELARRRRQGLRDALATAGRLALENGCLAITIAGDLYESERSGSDTGHFLADTFAAWRPLRVLIAPGNHDALLPGSLYRRTEWPENVTIFGEPRFEPLEIADGITVWGLAHREPAWRGDPLAGAVAGGAPGVHLALFHGAEVGSRPQGKSIHGPFHAEDIHRRGFAAALCGHYHRRRVDPGTGLLYPGSLEPLGFDEEGDRGPVMVEITGAGEVRFAPQTTNRWSALTLRCDASDCASLGAVVDLVESACAAACEGADPGHVMIRVDLDGAVDCTVPLDVYTVESVVRDHLGVALVKLRDFTSPLFDVAAAMDEESTRGAFVRTLTASIDAAGEGAEAEVLRDAMRYGLMALSGAEVGLR